MRPTVITVQFLNTTIPGDTNCVSLWVKGDLSWSLMRHMAALIGQALLVSLLPVSNLYAETGEPGYLARASKAAQTLVCKAPSTSTNNGLELVLPEIFPEVIYKTPGRDSGSAALFLPIRQIAQPLAELGDACLNGQSQACNQFEHWLERLVAADALRFDRAKHQASSVSLVTGALSGNITLRPISQYAEALRQRGHLEKMPSEKLLSWINRRVEEYNHYPNKLTPAAAQNLVLNSVAARLTVKSMAGQDLDQRAEALQRAKDVFKLHLDTARPNGSLPAETRRGVSALKYSNMALGLLVVIAELSHDQGVNLYDYKSTGGVTLHKAIGFLMESIQDETMIDRYAAENYAPTDISPDGRQSRNFMRDHLDWMHLYLQRYPTGDLADTMRFTLATYAKPTNHLDEVLGVFFGCSQNNERTVP